jgi:hypothetical protein
MKICQSITLLLLGLVILCGCTSEDDSSNGNGGYNPVIDPADFVSGVNNPYFNLEPGRTLHFLNTIIEGADTTYENIDVTMTSDTRVVMGVTCVVVRDVVTVNGDTLEDTYDWHAQNMDGDVWYFGEDTRAWENGQWITEGSWEAGVDGALPGIVMWGDPDQHLGEAYYQEFYEDEAMDQAEVLSVDDTVTVAYGFFDTCVKTRDWTELEPGVEENKFYAPDIGVVLTVMTQGGNSREELVGITN